MWQHSGVSQWILGPGNEKCKIWPNSCRHLCCSYTALYHKRAYLNQAVTIRRSPSCSGIDLVIWILNHCLKYWLSNLDVDLSKYWPSDLDLVTAGTTTIQQCSAGWIQNRFLNTFSQKRKRFPECDTLTWWDVLRKVMNRSRSCRSVSIFLFKVCSSSKTFVALSTSSLKFNDGDAVPILFSCSVKAFKGLSCLLDPLGGWELVLLFPLEEWTFLIWSRICHRISASWFTI